MLDYADNLLKQLEEEGGETPPGLAELQLDDDQHALTIEVLDTLGYAVRGTGDGRDIVDVHTGEVVSSDVLPFEAVEVARFATYERQRASVLIEALENIADNPLFHAGDDTQELARRALREFEEVCGG